MLHCAERDAGALKEIYRSEAIVFLAGGYLHSSPAAPWLGVGPGISLGWTEPRSLCVWDTSDMSLLTSRQRQEVAALAADTEINCVNYDIVILFSLKQQTAVNKYCTQTQSCSAPEATQKDCTIGAALLSKTSACGCSTAARHLRAQTGSQGLL